MLLFGARPHASTASLCICCFFLQYFNPSLGDVGVQSARFGDWKLIVGLHCDSQQVWQAWPTPEDAPVPFGLTSAQEAGRDGEREVREGERDGGTDGGFPCLRVSAT